jgi:hypothetical protein
MITLLTLATISFPIVSAETDPYFDLKPMRIRLEVYQHELDFNVTNINASVPGVSSALLNSLNKQLKTRNNVTLYNLRLDRQIRPFLNVYGSIGKVSDTTKVSFSGLNLGISDMIVRNKGTAYTLGAVFSRKRGKWINSLEIVHSRIHLDGNKQEVLVNTAVPTLGLITKYGVFNLGLAYQAIKAEYDDTVNAPIVGVVPVKVSTENNDTFQVLAGFDMRLTKNTYINTKVGLNGQKQLLLQLIKRF